VRRKPGGLTQPFARISSTCSTGHCGRDWTRPSSLRRWICPTSCRGPWDGPSTGHTTIPSAPNHSHNPIGGTSGSPSSPLSCRGDPAETSMPPAWCHCDEPADADWADPAVPASPAPRHNSSASPAIARPSSCPPHRARGRPGPCVREGGNNPVFTPTCRAMTFAPYEFSTRRPWKLYLLIVQGVFCRIAGGVWRQSYCVAVWIWDVRVRTWDL